MMIREEAYQILDSLLMEKMFSAKIECAIAMALDDMMVVAKLHHLEKIAQEMIDNIADMRGKE